MPKAALTVAAIEALKATGARRELADGACKGLSLIALPNGTRTWSARYVNAAGKQCRLPLGPFPQVTLAAARAKADAVRADVRDGKDPAADKLATRERATMERDRLALGEVVKVGDNFATVWATFDAQHIAPTFRPGTAAKWRRIYAKTLAPRWDARPLAEITAADVYGVIHSLQSTPDAADSVLTVCKAFFNWTVAAPRHLIAANPCNGIAKVKRAKATEGEESNADRVLTDAELKTVWAACDLVAPQFAGIVKLLILTGARRTEVAAMQWNEVAGDVWTIPAARSKNGKAHRVHLSPEALAVLAAVPRLGDSPFVFSTNGRSAVSGFSKFKDKLDEAASLPAAERLPAWHLHSLRKTFATGLARLGVSLQVAERCLNHSSGSLGGLVAVYNRHGYEAEQAAAWDSWSRHVAGVLSGATSNVVPMRRA